VRIDGIARKAAASEETGYRVIDLRPRNEAMEVAIVGGS
jgi:hypothetical protein